MSRLLGAVLGAALMAAPATAERGDLPVNLGLVHEFGLGAVPGIDQEARTLKIPFSFRLLRSEDRGWGLRLRVETTLGVHNFTVLEEFELDQIRTATILPGVEFVFPVGASWTLRPFQLLGIGSDFDAGDRAIIASGGVRAVGTRPWGAFTLEAIPKLSFNLALGSTTDLDDQDFGYGEIKLALRRSLWFTWQGGRRPDLGVFARGAYLFDTVTYDLDPGVIESVNEQYEVGLVFGSEPRLKIWRIPIPRVHLGYRFGEGIEGWRIKFGD